MSSRIRAVLHGFVKVCLCFCAAYISVVSAEESEVLSEEEQLLVGALDYIRAESLDRALASLETLLERYPNFRLAQMVYADTLLAKVSPITPFGALLDGHVGPMNGLKDEALKRFRHHRAAPPTDRLPVQLLSLPEKLTEAVVVDLSASRFYLFENHSDGPRLVNDYYVSSGKRGAKKLREGDQKTPVGVYFITGQIPGSVLPDFYGNGALPIDYPNEWDLRHGRTGYGIWIHGVPSDTYSRAPRASNGCIVLANDDLAAVWGGLVGGGTPVIVTEEAMWVSRGEMSQRRSEISDQIKAWISAWESREMDRYVQFYSTNFRSETKDVGQWIDHKSQVHAKKTYIEVVLSDLSILGYPGEKDMVVVTFMQDYKSNDFSNVSNKRQYWRREPDGVWRIVYEGLVEIRPEHIQGIPYSVQSNLTGIGGWRIPVRALR